ncbi:MAG: two-component regulator propeller domain-containing protein [Opitutus sp.]
MQSRWGKNAAHLLRAIGAFSVFLPTVQGDVAESAKPLPPYSIRVWQREQGLPQNSVTAITQDPDGYLWMGTYDGLARFDGARFVTFDGANTPALENGRITCLYSASDGSVWIGHETGNVTQFKAGRFVSRRAASTSPNEGVVGISADAAGKIWILGHNGILERLEDGRLLAPEDGVADPSPFLLFAPDAMGGMALARNGLLSTLVDGKVTTHVLADHSGDTGIYGLRASRKGGLWVISEGMVRRREGNQWVENWGPTPWNPQDAAAAIVELHNGALAVGTLNSGLYLLAKGQTPLHFDRKNGLPHDWIRSLYEDAEKNIWVGTGSGGLAALREASFTTLDAPDGRNGRSVLAVAPSREGGVWVGTEGAGLYHYLAGNWTHFGESEGLNHGFVWSITEADDHVLWVGTWGGGLFKRRDNDRFVRDERIEASTPILALFQPTQNASMWLGTRSGLVAVTASRVQTYGVEAGLISPDVRAMTGDQAGVIWFGMVGGGLGSIRDGVLHQFGRKDGMPSAFVQSLLVDESGALWIGTTDGGLCRLKNGKFAVLSTKHGLPSNVIGHIEDDQRGHLWMSTHNGIFRVSKVDANRCADGQIPSVTGQQFGRSEGLPTLEFTGGQNAGCRTADGRLWFSTTAGVVVVDPQDVTTNQLPPRTVIEELTVEGIPVVPTGNTVRIPAGKRRVEVKFTGLSFAAPEKVKFRYRLNGLEHDWLEAGTNRSVSYNYLPPGRYDFEVIACNNDGVWAEHPATQSFTVLPFFWQTWWFRALGTILVLSAAVLAGRTVTRRRMKHRVERAEQQQAVERERTRIARDIHDDLGASLTRITLLSQSARGELKLPDHVIDDLNQINGTAREVTRAMDEIVWAVNPKHDTLDSLAAYLGKFAQDFLRSANVRCRLNLPMELPPWRLTAEIRHNVFLAFKETLHNILKHSHATEVRISLSVDLRARAFVLTIEDDGRGFDSEHASGTTVQQPDRVLNGHGLSNISSRLAEIGGRYEVNSQPGKGTCTRFVLGVREVSG